MLKNHPESLPDCQIAFCKQFELYIMVVEVTKNMNEYRSRRSQQPENVNFAPIIRGLRIDIFDRGQVLNPFYMCRIELKRKKVG